MAFVPGSPFDVPPEIIAKRIREQSLNSPLKKLEKLAT